MSTPTKKEPMCATLDALPLKSHGSPLSRNNLTRDGGPTPHNLIYDLREEVSGVISLVDVLTHLAGDIDFENDMGAYRLGEYIHDQLEAVDALLSQLYGVLPESFDD